MTPHGEPTERQSGSLITVYHKPHQKTTPRVKKFGKFSHSTLTTDGSKGAKIAGAYTRTNTKNTIMNSKIRYICENKSRVNNWLKVNRLQLPLPNSQSNSAANSIPQAATKNNLSGEKSSGNFRSAIKTPYRAFLRLSQ